MSNRVKLYIEAIIYGLVGAAALIYTGVHQDELTTAHAVLIYAASFGCITAGGDKFRQIKR